MNPARGESPWSPALQFDWPLSTAGKRGHAVDRATADALAAHYGLASEIAALERDVRLARVELASAHSAARALENEASVVRELAATWRTRVELGAVSAAAAAPAESAAFVAEGDLAAARAREAAADAALAAAIGVPRASLREIALAPVSRAGGDAAPDTTRTALAERADVLAALARYAAAEAALRGEVAKQFPDLRIGSGYQWDQGQSKFLVGLSLDLPILDHNRGPIAEALAARERAAAEFDAAQSQALAEIDSAQAAAQAARDRRELRRASARELGRQAARAESGLAAGALNRGEALAARVLALRARRELRDAELQGVAADEALAAALAPARSGIEAIERALAARRESP